jgi:hypothetical protein
LKNGLKDGRSEILIIAALELKLKAVDAPGDKEYVLRRTKRCQGIRKAAII